MGLTTVESRTSVLCIADKQPTDPGRDPTRGQATHWLPTDPGRVPTRLRTFSCRLGESSATDRLTVEFHTRLQAVAPSLWSPAGSSAAVACIIALDGGG